jgi:hypothetical protein
MTERRTGRMLLLGAAAATGLALFLARGATRDESAITYPPLDTPKPLGSDLWIVDSGPFSAMGMKLPVRMTVIRLADGGLLLHSPTRYTPELARALEAIGPIRHLVASTMAHWTFLKDWQQACPDATSWGVPVLRTRPQVQRSGVRIDRDLGDSAPPEWSGGIDQGLVRGAGGFEEAWFFHKASRALVLTDLIENLDPQKLGPVTASVMRATLATAGTSALHARAALLPNKAEVRAAVDEMIALAPETVIFAHGDLFRGRGTEQLRRAFSWLK